MLISDFSGHEETFFFRRRFFVQKGIKNIFTGLGTSVCTIESKRLLLLQMSKLNRLANNWHKLKGKPTHF